MDTPTRLKSITGKLNTDKDTIKPEEWFELLLHLRDMAKPYLQYICRDPIVGYKMTVFDSTTEDEVLAKAQFFNGATEDLRVRRLFDVRGSGEDYFKPRHVFLTRDGRWVTWYADINKDRSVNCSEISICDDDGLKSFWPGDSQLFNFALLALTGEAHRIAQKTAERSAKMIILEHDLSNLRSRAGLP